VTSSIKS